MAWLQGNGLILGLGILATVFLLLPSPVGALKRLVAMVSGTATTDAQEKRRMLFDHAEIIRDEMAQLGKDDADLKDDALAAVTSMDVVISTVGKMKPPKAPGAAQ